MISGKLNIMKFKWAVKLTIGLFVIILKGEHKTSA
jgi:hypothetical protein